MKQAQSTVAHTLVPSLTGRWAAEREQISSQGAGRLLFHHELQLDGLTILRFVSHLIDLQELSDQLRAFARDRDWGQFHSPKNLAMALAAEAGELLEIFQWLDADIADQGNREIRSRTAQELADILIYAVRMADVLDVNLAEAIARKIEANEARYPIEEVKGKAVKRP